MRGTISISRSHGVTILTFSVPAEAVRVQGPAQAASENGGTRDSTASTSALAVHMPSTMGQELRHVPGDEPVVVVPRRLSTGSTCGKVTPMPMPDGNSESDATIMMPVDAAVSIEAVIGTASELAPLGTNHSNDCASCNLGDTAATIPAAPSVASISPKVAPIVGDPAKRPRSSPPLVTPQVDTNPAPSPLPSASGFKSTITVVEPVIIVQPVASEGDSQRGQNVNQADASSAIAPASSTAFASDASASLTCSHATQVTSSRVSSENHHDDSARVAQLAIPGVVATCSLKELQVASSTAALATTGTAPLVVPTLVSKAAVDLTGMRVLVVDDEKPIRRLCQRLLEKFGCTVVLLEDGDEVAQTLQDSGYRPMSAAAMPPTAVEGEPSTSPPFQPFDVILMDIMMRRSNGVDVVVELMKAYTSCSSGPASMKGAPGSFSDEPDRDHRHSDWSDGPAARTVLPPILAMTANTSLSDLAMYRQVGFSSVLPKPFDAAALRAKLTAYHGAKQS